MEPNRQMEIQLGHMCNNRCVFCVSGQRTELREAFPLAGDPIVDELKRGYAGGIRKLTLLGGEPTLQPEFLRVLKAAVELGFDEIVLFTNGVKTARPAFVDEILAIGGRITWRLSFQGADQESHERTTKKRGSFGRLVRTLENLHARDQPITVNMCVVRSNFESVASFPELLLPFGVKQLHLDMMRPLDSGRRSEEEMREMLPYYSEMVPPLSRMIEGFPPGFDVNIGNLPYCVAPHLAPWIHHDGEHTLTVAIDGDDSLSDPWDKYEVKRRDKLKPSSCRNCVFDSQCSGVFETYRDFYGLDELKPILPSELPRIDPEHKLFPLHVEPMVQALLNSLAQMAVKLGSPTIRRDSRQAEVLLWFPVEGHEKQLSIAILPPGGGLASSERASFHCLDSPALPASQLRELLKAMASVFFAAERADSQRAERVEGREEGFEISALQQPPNEAGSSKVGGKPPFGSENGAETTENGPEIARNASETAKNGSGTAENGSELRKTAPKAGEIAPGTAETGLKMGNAPPHSRQEASADISRADFSWRHPPGDDAAFIPEAGITGGIDTVLGLRLRQLRQEAPFAPLNWTQTRLDPESQRLILRLEHRGAVVKVFLWGRERGIAGSYQLNDNSLATPEIAQALRRIFDILKSPLPHSPQRASRPSPVPPPLTASSAAPRRSTKGISLPVL